ncbi:endopeptidase La [Moraxella catarrhalis]|uniref:Lon protease n=1 Tax=Moraxella catarrhalis TaxID=480 RepID=A0A198UEF9_MORCA|nr:endopeptidase La [Moraxella catarrhalis]OAU94231.1 ATP-dependent protease La Type I [Moraxella catarrhalis]OAU94801.1 ATP-dependent protease La Type I [Moraxella catarrhalis]OAU99598.1 ATP-dependent protease La Type I [Moraxella catarrhalis]
MTISKSDYYENPGQLPLLAVRDVVVYPYMQIALFVGREQSIKAIELAQEAHDGELIVVSQKDSLAEEININDLYQFGTRCRIVSTMPHDSDDKCLKVLIEGLERVQIGHIQNASDDADDSLIVEFTAADVELNLSQEEADAQKSVLLELFSDYAESALRNSRELIRVVNGFDNLLELIYFVAMRTQLPLDKKQALLESGDAAEYFKALSEYFTNTKTERSIESELQDTVRKQMENNQREYFLNEKMKAIKSELSDLNNGAEDDDTELENRLKEADLPDDVRKKAESEFKKLKQMPASSSEASVVRGYVEWILDTPWNKASKVSINLDKAKQTLDKDHYGLDDVKDRILEYLAVQSRVKQIRGPILCLVGPPGVGKTSLGESIARATGRKFVRMALGGVRDEAEIRGHRRTYIGAMPGKIVQSLAKVEVKNPLFLLDEIDKMAQDFRGDPASALLEVLDPSQNKAFNDHYLDLDLDLSQVMFICTANSMNIPPALLDRMEVIRLPGYTEDEKMAIANNYLTPKALEQNGLKPNELNITDEALTSIIRHYTREAGVRNLEREINKISRKAVRTQIEKYGTKPKKGVKIEGLTINDENISDFLGVKPFDYGLAEKDPEIGRITGLAWTSVGGELLTIESATMQGKGELVFTGSLGDVMKESIRAAMSVVRANGERFGIDYEKFKNTDLHIHMPEGATPKDGPSAGIALTTAIVSAMTGIAIRADIAMTGEVTLRGKVLRIGGLKEKLLAAHRGGIKHVLIPKSNERDLIEIPDNVKEGLVIQSVETIDEVLAAALVEPIHPLPPQAVTHKTSSDTVRS